MNNVDVKKICRKFLRDEKIELIYNLRDTLSTSLERNLLCGYLNIPSSVLGDLSALDKYRLDSYYDYLVEQDDHVTYSEYVTSFNEGFSVEPHHPADSISTLNDLQIVEAFIRKIEQEN